MPSEVRALKIGSVIQRSLPQVFSVLGICNISVSQVKVSADLGYAKVYVCAILGKDSDELLGLLGEQRFLIVKKLRIKLAFRMPYLDFRIDSSYGYYDNIDRLLKRVMVK